MEKIGKSLARILDGNIILLFGIAKITNGIDILFPLKWKPVYLRALTMTTCMFCFFAASPKLSFSQMAAGLYTFPIFVSFLAVIFLNERVGVWRLFALILGSFGALLILEPWSKNFTYLQFLPIMAGFFFACNIILIRKYCRQESVMSLTLALQMSFSHVSPFLHRVCIGEKGKNEISQSCTYTRAITSKLYVNI